MPLTAKGEKIEAAMKKEYGSKKGESVFYASRNKGTIKGVDAKVCEVCGETDCSHMTDAKDADKYTIHQHGSGKYSWRIHKNGEVYNGPLESKEAAERVIARLTGTKDANPYKGLSRPVEDGLTLAEFAQRGRDAFKRVEPAKKS